ncbi:MAG: hypothetical protein U9Q82_02560 [Chloroflexota bacterium]|nr:hypothetical protein [Chloroflexota bacterium]
MNRDRIHLSIHIERTGGTTLLAELEKFYGPKNILIYKAGIGKFIRLSDIPVSPANIALQKGKSLLEGTKLLHFIYKFYVRFVNRSNDVLKWIEPDDLPNDFIAIHGHFKLDQVEHLVENPYITAIFRHPLERMVSQFLHWRRAGGLLGWRVEVPFDENISFVEYAFREEFANFQTQAIGNNSVDEIDLIGITPYTDRFIAKIKGKNTNNSCVTRVNEIVNKPGYKKLGITKAIVKRFKDFNARDYENYERAIQLVRQYI